MRWALSEFRSHERVHVYLASAHGQLPVEGLHDDCCTLFLGHVRFGQSPHAARVEGVLHYVAPYKVREELFAIGWVRLEEVLQVLVLDAQTLASHSTRASSVRVNTCAEHLYAEYLARLGCLNDAALDSKPLHHRLA